MYPGWLYPNYSSHYIANIQNHLSRRPSKEIQRHTYPILSLLLHLFTSMCVLPITHFLLTYLPTFLLTLSSFSPNLRNNHSWMVTMARDWPINLANGLQWSALLRGRTMVFVPWRVKLQRVVSVRTNCPSHSKRLEILHTTPQMYGKHFKYATNAINHLLLSYIWKIIYNSANVPHTVTQWQGLP